MAKSSKKDWSAIVWALGWLLSVFSALKKAAEEFGVPFEAFARLTSERGMRVINEVVCLVKRDYKNALCVSVTALNPRIRLDARLDQPHTLALPGLEALRPQFASVDRDLAKTKFLLIGQLRSAPAKPGRIVLLRMGYECRGAEVLAEMGFRRLRPLHPAELIDLWGRLPDLRHDCPLVALGAVTPDSAQVMEIYEPGVGCLGLQGSQHEWSSETAFPAMCLDDEGE